MYRRTMQGWQRHLDFVILDELSLLLSIVLTVFIGGRSGSLPEDIRTSTFIVGALLVNLLLCIMAGSMNDAMRRGYFEELVATVRHVLFVFSLFTVLLLIAYEAIRFPRTFLMIMFGTYTVLSYASRVAWKQVVRVRLKKAEGKKTMLLVTDSAHAPEILRRMLRGSYSVAGVVLADRDAKGETIEGVDVVAGIGDAAEYLCHAWIDEVFFVCASLNSGTQELMDRCREMALTIHLYVALQGVDEKKQVLENIAGYEFLTANIKLMSGGDVVLKRLFDLAAGLVGSVLAGLVVLIFGPLIRLRSPGPLLYKQVRVGENGRQFEMFKLRTMYVNADRRKQGLSQENSHGDGMMFKMDFDPRVVGNRILPDGTQKKGVGDFVRRTSLDEFPQFFNVLRGEMSVVGTRPPTLDEWERYQYHHRARMSIKPGLTGLWQISERKDSMDFDEVVKLDTDYIADWSIGLDLWIVARTVAVMAKHLSGCRGQPEAAVGKHAGE